LIFGLALLAAGVVIAPAGAGVGAAVGAFRAPSAGMVERNEETLARALADASFSDALAYQIVEVGGARPIFFCADPVPAAVATWLALDAAQVLLTSNDSTDWRPDLRLRVSLRGRLLRDSDGGELGAWTWQHEGRQAPLFEWGANDASLFRAELERALRA